MKMQEYVDLIRELNEKNGVEWDKTTSILAVYQYMCLPAVAEYYSGFELRRAEDGTPIICEIDHNRNGAVKSVGRFDYDGSKIASEEAEKISYFMDNNGYKPGEKILFPTDLLKSQMSVIRERFLNSNSFDEFADGFNLDNIEEFEMDRNSIFDSKLDFKIKNFLKFASVYNKLKDVDINENPDKNMIIFTMLLSNIDNCYKFANHRHQTILRPILNVFEKTELTDQQRFDSYMIMANYDQITTDSHYFDIRKDKDKAEHFKKMAETPEIRDNTVFGIVMNNPDDMINKLADTFMFNEIKSLALIQTRLALKAPSLEEMIEARPLVNEVYQEAIKRDPMMTIADMDDRFQHIHIKDSEFDLGAEKSLSFSTLMDGVGLYGEDNRHHYLTRHPEIIAYPRGTNLIMNDQPFERFYGHDGIGPHYVGFARKSQLTTETGSLVMEKLFISKNLDSKHVEKLFENLFQECMINKMAFVIEDANFHNVIGERNFSIFNEFKDKYSGIVPTYSMNNDLSKYRAYLNSDLTYNDVLTIENNFKQLKPKDGEQKLYTNDYYDYIEKYQDEKTKSKKPTPKL